MKMASTSNKENNANINYELDKVNLFLHENSIELWRIEEKCRLKVKSIEDIEKSFEQVLIENEFLEKELCYVKSRIDEVRDTIVSIDKIIMSFFETLAHLEVKYKKKEFSVNKSMKDYDLQLFIRMELYQKEEERLNNLPEIKSLKIADSELNNTKLEYDKLLIEHKDLKEKIAKTEEENYKKQNYVVIQFAKVYVEMVFLEKKKENNRILLRELETEYYEKLIMKNSILDSKKKKVNTVSYWTDILYPLNSKVTDIKFDSLNENLKPNFEYSGYNNVNPHQKTSDLKLNSESKKNVSFLASLEDNKIADTNSNILKVNSNVDTNLTPINVLKNNNYEESLSIKNNQEVNGEQLIKSILKRQNKINVSDNAKSIVENEIEFITKKRKILEEQSTSELKKPYNVVEDEISKNKNEIHSKTIEPSVMNENLHIENNLVQNLLIDESFETTNQYKHCINKNIGYDDNLQQANSFKSNQQSNLINSPSENFKMIDDIDFDGNSFCEQNNNVFSDLFWNNSEEQEYENSGNISFCGSDLSGIFELPFNNQYQDKQLNNLNSVNNNFMFQKFKNDAFVKKDHKNDKTTNGMTTSSNHYDQPIRPHFMSSKQFKFNLN